MSESDQLHCGIGRKIRSDRDYSVKHAVACTGFESLIYEGLHRQCAVEENAKAFDRVKA